MFYFRCVLACAPRNLEMQIVSRSEPADRRGVKIAGKWEMGNWGVGDYSRSGESEQVGDSSEGCSLELP